MKRNVKKRGLIILFIAAAMVLTTLLGMVTANIFTRSTEVADTETVLTAIEPESQPDSSMRAAASEESQIEEIILKPNVKEQKYAPTNNPNDTPYSNQTNIQSTQTRRKIIVLDPGHGMTSDEMSDEEKENQGWTYTDKGWGEWRHWKTGSRTEDCEGYGCSGRAPENGSCWYPIANGDRDGEGDINLRNVMYAKQYLEEMGYDVRLTRDNNSNPSMTKRLKSCYPNGDKYEEPDADAFVCIHSNAGGGRGSAYIEMSGVYDQYGISASYADDGNRLGRCINSAIVENTSLGEYSGGTIELPELILFCKSPITIAYLEIGFFDNDSDMAILDSEAEAIGRSIAEGIDAYFNG